MRDENQIPAGRLPPRQRPGAFDDASGALRAYVETGIDSIFSDNPDTALPAAEDFRRSQG